MRAIITLNDLQQADTLCRYLQSLGIDNQIETTKVVDWGDSNYSDVSYKIWVYNEDLLEDANKIAEEFAKNSGDEKYKVRSKSQINASIKSILQTPKLETSRKEKNRVSPLQTPMGPVTLYFLIACCLIFFLTELTAVNNQDTASLSSIPSFYSPLKKEMLFDYPHAFEIIDQIVTDFGPKALLEPNEFPKEAVSLMNQFTVTPYWKGYYDKITDYLKRKPPSLQAPMFEKISDGQWWRLFTPSLLHADIFHLLFNMIWLAVLGKQLEQRMGAFRYILFIVVAGVITNVAQYLMSGWSFLGFSGVLCAMLAFVWMRQRRSAWEGYFLQPSTMSFILIFLGLMVLFQAASFYAEIVFNTVISPPIANTAHMVGLAVGLLFGRLNFFKSNY